MNTLEFKLDPLSITNFSVRESDEYTKQVYLMLTRISDKGITERCNEIFLSANQLDLLGRFLCRQASEIQFKQAENN